MNPTDRTPIILACLADTIAERASRDDFPAEQSALMRALYGVAADPIAVARLWPATAQDSSLADRVDAVLFGEGTERHFADHRLAAVAARLAAIAAAIHVQGNDAAPTAATLWRAASRLLGHDATASTNPTTINLWRQQREALTAENEHLRAECTARTTQLHRVISEISAVLCLPAPHPFDPCAAGDLANAVKYLKDDVINTRDLRIQAEGEIDRLTRTHAAEVARLTDALATAKADLEEALRSPVSAGPMKRDVQAAATGQNARESYREVAMKAGARDCSVFVGPGEDVTVVVELRDGVSLDTVRAALDRVVSIWAGAYTLREVRSPPPAPPKCRHRLDEDPAACDHCSLGSSS